MSGPDLTKGLAELDVHDLCAELTLDLSLFDFDVFDIQPPIPLIPNPGDVAGDIIGKVNAALVPFTPIFDVLDILLALPPLLDAIASINPAKILKALAKFLEKLQKLKKHIPQLKIPKLVKQLIGVIILALMGIRNDLEAIIAAQSRIDLSAQRAFALGAGDLTAALECAQVNLDFQMAVIQNNAAPLNRLIGFINVFCQIVGLPELPGLNFEPGSKAADCLAPLDDLIDQLKKAQDAIPL